MTDPRPHAFVDRHVGPSNDDIERMLGVLGYASLDALTDVAVPESIRDAGTPALPPPATEQEVLAELRELASRNTVLEPMIGLGYYGTITPPVIRRRVLEDPGWYTAYTPYQPEISQGRLEALLNFQTVVADLTGLPTANASLLDEGTAAAEAMSLLRRAGKSPSQRFLVHHDVFPQTLAVLRTRAEAVGVDVVAADLPQGVPDGDAFGLLLQYPGDSGAIRDWASVVAEAKERGIPVAFAADLLALTLLKPPGEMGADVVVGSAQRFGVPMAFGGPHAAFISVRDGLERQLPGRLVGVSVDADGNRALRLALQTREQHIRREKATSNICTAQVLLAVVAAMYAVHHGAEGLRGIASQTHRHAAAIAGGLRRAGIDVRTRSFFDTVHVSVPGRAHAVVAAAADLGVNLRHVDADTVGIATSEVTTSAEVIAACRAFGVRLEVGELAGLADETDAIPAELVRTSE